MSHPRAGPAPFGYKREDGRIVLHPDEAPVRLRIFELFAEHERRQTVCEILNAEGHRTRNGSLFTTTTITRLFYLDPPYYGTEDYYGRELFSRDDFEKLASQLADIKGKFILSLNATPEVRNIFKAFAIEEVPVTYTTAHKVTKLARELIISNCAEHFRHVSAKEVGNG